MDWFRFYPRAMTAPRVANLSDELFRDWIRLLCVANAQPRRGWLPSAERLAIELHRSVDDTKALLAALGPERKGGAGLVERPSRQSAGYMHDWDNLQRASDDSRDRVARLREKRRGNGPSNKEAVTATGVQRRANGGVTVTSPLHPDLPPDPPRDSDSERDSPPISPPRAEHRGRSAPADALWKALEDTCKKPGTSSAVQRRVASYHELRDAGATPEQVALRATEWGRRYTVPLTDKALASHWSELAEPFTKPSNGRANGHAPQRPKTALDVIADELRDLAAQGAPDDHDPNDAIITFPGPRDVPARPRQAARQLPQQSAG